MHTILERIVRPTHSAFAPHQAIHDNILLAHEVINKFHHVKGKKGYVTINLDIEKTYDRIEWDFLQHSLRSMGFHLQWIAWILECVAIVTYSLIINNETCGFFKPTRGLRQGDPLSPYLFILCLDILAQKLHWETEQPK